MATLPVVYKTVNIVFVGAGPSTLGIMCNAMKTGKLRDLVNKDGGIAILDKGCSFGGGALQLFGINSNTSANGFIKCTYLSQKNNNRNRSLALRRSSFDCKSTIPAGNVNFSNSDAEDNSAIDSERDEPQIEPRSQYSVKPSCMPYDCFKDLVNVSPIFKCLREYGPHLVPLSLVGLYMNYAGNHLLHHIYETFGHKIFHHSHHVTSVQQLENGEFLTTAT